MNVDKITLIIFILFAIAVVIAAIKLLKSKSEAPHWTPPEKRAGNRGERAAAEVIGSVLNDNDVHLKNVKLCVDGKPTECDNIIINNYGVYIIEVKTIEGELVGDEEDYDWIQDKIDRYGIRHTRKTKNPIHQVKRQIYILSQTLKRNNINVYIEGYVIFMYGNAPFGHEMILENVDDIDAVIHGNPHRKLTNYDVAKIKNLIS